VSAAPIDYAALADQARSGVDYAALADKVRGDQRGFTSSALDASGLSSLAHPIDALMGIPEAVKQAGSNIAEAYDAVKQAGITAESRRAIGRAVPIVGPALSTAQDQYDAGNKAGAAGTIVGTVGALLGPKALKGASDLAPTLSEATQSTAEALQKVGDASQAAGNRVINETVGSYKSDFKRGANPGRGYNSTGQGISFTMRGLAEKAEQAKQTVGSSIQKVISASGANKTLIPVQDVINAVGGPIKQAYDAELSPGGMQNTAPFEQYAKGFTDVMKDGIRKGGFTPQEVFDLKKQVAAKAKFNNTTPEGIMDVRQSQVGALGGLLKSVIPELAPLNQAYQDLVKLGDRAAWRAESGSMSLRQMMGHGSKAAAAAIVGAGGGAEAGIGTGAALTALDSLPSRTAIATGLHVAGKTLANAGSSLEDWLRNP
jgi:hypothetical protein